VVTALAACTRQDLCLRNATIVANISLKTNTDSVARDTTLPQLSIAYPTLSLGARAFGIQKFNMLLNTLQDSTVLYVSTDTIGFKVDTLTVYHKRKLHFISKACGYNYFFDIDSIASKKKIFKSIQITDTLVTDDATRTHMWFYL
jgi:hypothetical protein